MIGLFGPVFESTRAEAGLILSDGSCAVDVLPTWNHDRDPIAYDAHADIVGTVRGRNAWLAVCLPELYKQFFPGSNRIGADAEFTSVAGVAIHERAYPVFGTITGTNPATGETTFNNRIHDHFWQAPTEIPRSKNDKSCRLPPGFEVVGLCIARDVNLCI